MSEWPINDSPSATFPLYSRANVGEIFPDPITPLNASAGFHANLDPGWSDAFVACGVWGHDLYDPSVARNVVPAFGSYLYINMSLMRLFGVRVPGMSAEAVDLQYFGDMPGIPSYESERRSFDDDPAHAESAGAWLENEVLGATGLPEYDSDRERVLDIRKARPDMASLSDAELCKRITGFSQDLRALFKRHIEASLKCGVGLGAIAQIAEAVGKPEHTLPLVAGIGDVDSAVPSQWMWTLSRAARSGPVGRLFDDVDNEDLYAHIMDSSDPVVASFRANLNTFLNDWDFRGPVEWEIRASTWGVKPSLALSTIDRMRGVDDDEAPERKADGQAEQRERAAAEVRAALAGDESAAAQFEASLNAAALWMRGRERARTTGAMLIHELRLPALELGKRGAEAGNLETPEQVFMLFAGELDDYLAVPHEFTATLREREATYQTLFDYEPPFVVISEPPPLEQWQRRSDKRVVAAEAGELLQGVSGCAGTARGRARVLRSAADPSALEPGEILVAPITDPSWTPLFVASAAVIVDVGAPFSHAAIVSRELGIPCVVSATDATGRIPDGALIEVDGTSATVTILDE